MISSTRASQAPDHSDIAPDQPKHVPSGSAIDNSIVHVNGEVSGAWAESLSYHSISCPPQVRDHDNPRTVAPKTWPRWRKTEDQGGGGAKGWTRLSQLALSEPKTPWPTAPVRNPRSICYESLLLGILRFVPRKSCATLPYLTAACFVALLSMNWPWISCPTSTRGWPMGLDGLAVQRFCSSRDLGFILVTSSA
jgi:hypothetical protein